MHLAQGTLSTSVTLLTSVAAIAAVGVAYYGARREVTKRKMPTLFAMSGFVFLAQMVNCSMGLGFSGHLLGGALLAVICGPWSAMLSMAAILSAQTALFGDGSWSTLGANFLNIGVVSVGVAYGIFRLLQGRRNSQLDAGQAFAMAIAAYSSTVAAAVSLALIADVQMSSLLYTHGIIGILEVCISVAMFAVCVASLRDTRPSAECGFSLRPIAFACALALCLAPFSSQLPDGLQYELNSPVAVVD